MFILALLVYMKKAIIIGASSGIGRQLAKILVENNYKVGITGRRTELLAEIQSEHPEAYCTKTIDVNEVKSAINQLDELINVLGGLDLLIHCSGIGEINEVLDFEIENQIIQTNVVGFTNIIDWGFNFFKRQGQGHLVGISSIGGLRGSKHAPAYNASKAYQINYLEGLNQKVASLNKPIFVTDIRPGLVNTNMAKGDGLFWVMPLEKTSKQIFNAIKSKKKVAYVTRRWRMIAIVLKNIPRGIYRKL